MALKFDGQQLKKDGSCQHLRNRSSHSSISTCARNLGTRLKWIEFIPRIRSFASESRYSRPVSKLEPHLSPLAHQIPPATGLKKMKETCNLFGLAGNQNKWNQSRQKLGWNDSIGKKSESDSSIRMDKSGTKSSSTGGIDKPQIELLGNPVD
ncbi:hypothetical protein CR513_55794, partial [Mucuna pruriens]